VATRGTEIELLTSGVEQDGSKRVTWTQNTWLVNESLNVRPGWGVEAELDTTLGMNIRGDSSAAGFTSTDIKFGYEKHLGSHYIKTLFGNEQIVSVFAGRASADNLFGKDIADELYTPNWTRFYFVRIFDLTTRRSWEEVLYSMTAELAIAEGYGGTLANNLAPSLPSDWHGNYSSKSNGSKFLFGNEDSSWWFCTQDNKIYFGSKTAGIFVYRPADFKGYERQQVSSYLKDRIWRSEGTLVTRVNFANGVHEQSYSYADDSVLSGIQAAASFRGRLAYAIENVVWFSDAGSPGNVIGINTQGIASSNPITAMAEIRGNLVIFTESEMFFYSPSEGVIVSKGRPPVKIGENIGCVGSQAVCRFRQDIAWVSNSGVHVSQDGTSISDISDPIKSFWSGNGIMTNPMTSYYESNAGFADISSVTPPRMELHFTPNDVNIAYSHKEKALLFSCPDSNGCWSFTGMWSWWPTESNVSVSGGAPIVSQTRNLVRPHVLTSDEEIYCVFGSNQETILDQSESFSTPHIGIASPSYGNNYVLTRLGKGGALDRSTEDEDLRLGAGKYMLSLLDPSKNPIRFILGEPIKEESSTGDRYWVPVILSNDYQAFGQLIYYDIVIKFDRTRWNPEESLAGLINPRFPAERVDSSPGVVIARTENGAGVPGSGASFDRIHLRFDSSAVANTWTTYPNLSIAKGYHHNVLCYISFQSLTSADSVSGFGMAVLSAEVRDSVSTFAPVESFAWYQNFIRSDSSHNNDAKTQAVDWAYKGRTEDDSGNQIRARGVYANVQSTGSGSFKLSSGWLWGVYNIILGSDYKEYVSQIIDYAGNLTTVVDKLTIRSRLKDNSGSMTTKTFNNQARWGSTAAPADGNYLIDDSQDDTIAISDSVKGQRISYMAFGFMRNRAEGLAISSLKGVFRPAGSRRRRGR
jgi:hypothetical protein